MPTPPPSKRLDLSVVSSDNRPPTVAPEAQDYQPLADNNTAYAVRLSTHLSEPSSPAPNKRQYRAIASSGPVQEAQINGEEPPKKQARKERSCARCKQSNCKGKKSYRLCTNSPSTA
ncbi:hypothetical protein [Parasitella parasitica]|uniref:Uncharacterized protein n=1 Tax=Parasitella parasitica TaxID=35722 RepID=A0A0B7NCR5_9FUNG|nr:hypothetical protein [Parasitella parasitica]